ncbi:Zinc finger, FYVE/PHD-type [Pseudocohnilembus persalinus]|uniref:Zinc finger, FYVE/PHD-type n=1 Tax=Pseudocohnilembus persalinus TaxID=266149 RepID=A0A0V0QG15_PSEPJ|nr:Zinc finger, FYVE/PHD-type [Pseudocohnilembus persalinus]|eukprot:KRX01080.1 Zinc finger, FYVE/PHD-type [Pseudocohnilembus persalinus]
MQTEEQLLKITGIRYPGITQQEIFEILKKSHYEKELEQRKKIEQANKLTFEQQILKFYNTNADKRPGIKKIENNDGFYFQVDGVPENQLSETQRAYYRAYEPDALILTDIAAQVQKQNLNQAHAQGHKSGHTHYNQQVAPNQNLPIQLVSQQENNEGGKKQISMSFQIDQPLKPEKNNNNNANTNNNNNTKEQSKEEGIYCFCKKVLEQDMVACTNQKCSIEWFHVGCVGLLGLSQEKLNAYVFYCDDCKKEEEKEKEKEKDKKNK